MSLPPDIADRTTADVQARRCGPRALLGALQSLKPDLVAQLGAAGAAVEMMRMTGRPGARAARLPMEGLHAYAEGHALHLDVITPGHEVRMPRQPVFGRPAQAPFAARTRHVVRCALADAVVSSKSNFILLWDRALLDVQGDELDALPVLLDVDPVVFAPGSGAATFSIDAQAVDGDPMNEAFTLLGVNSFNYWHWQVEFLSRLIACRDLPGFERIPILVDRQMPPQNMQALRRIVGDAHPVRVVEPGEAVRVRKLWTCTMFVYIPLWPRPDAAHAPETFVLDAAAFARCFAELAPQLDSPDPTSPKRIYLTRKDSMHRRLVNRPEVEDWFAQQGFTMVDFGEHDFAAQLRLMRNADVVVGPNGAALVNTLFARPGTRIGVLDNPYDDNEWYAQVCQELGQKLLFVVGEVVDEDPMFVFNSSFRIDTAALPGFLRELTR